MTCYFGYILYKLQNAHTPQIINIEKQRTLLVWWSRIQFPLYSLVVSCLPSAALRFTLDLDYKNKKKNCAKYQMRYTRAQLIFYFSSLLSLASSRCGGEITEGKNLKALRNKLFVVNFGAHATLNDNGRIYSRKTEEVK